MIFVFFGGFIVVFFVFVLMGVLVEVCFEKWIKIFYLEVVKVGIMVQIYNVVFVGIISLDFDVLQKVQYQLEFMMQIWDYFDSCVNFYMVRMGKEVEVKNMWLF